jgi:hypothetical protein
VKWKKCREFEVEGILKQNFNWLQKYWLVPAWVKW